MIPLSIPCTFVLSFFYTHLMERMKWNRRFELGWPHRWLYENDATERFRAQFDNSTGTSGPSSSHCFSPFVVQAGAPVLWSAPTGTWPCNTYEYHQTKRDMTPFDSVVHLGWSLKISKMKPKLKVENETSPKIASWLNLDAVFTVAIFWMIQISSWRSWYV